MEHVQAGKVDERFYELLQRLQEADFALVELNLYLDTHPNDEAAIAQYNHLVQQRWMLAQEFEKAYGPLMNFGHSFVRCPWNWNDTPWPWQV
jgi:spore coat protein JB